MGKLEVIVTCAEEAATAEAGGADRLELIRDLDAGGLTPSWEIAQAVLRAVAIPVRVMLRENGSMLVGRGDELAALCAMAARLQRLPIDGLVMGWITGDRAVDTATLERVLADTGTARVTFHRAFEHLIDPFESLKLLKQYKTIDRILTSGGTGTWAERKDRLCAWSKAAAPEIQILVGGGLNDDEIRELMADPKFPEVHIGRAARTPQENHGAIDAQRIAQIKRRPGA